VECHASQPFDINNQNRDVYRADNGPAVGFPCISGWRYTPIDIYDEIADDVVRPVDVPAS